MNILGESRKRKLDQLSEDVEELQSVQSTHTTDIAENKTAGLSLQTQIDEIKTQITTLSEFDGSYWPGWYFAHSDVHTHEDAYEGTASASAGTDVRWGFSRADSLNADLYNYEILYTIRSSNGSYKLYTGFCQKAVNGDARVGSNYPTDGGWPEPNRTNNYGEALRFQITPQLTAWDTHDPDFEEIASNELKWVTQATNSVPFLLKVVIMDGRVTSMESSYDGSVLQDYVVTEGWDNMYVPSGPLHFFLLDTNNTGGGVGGSSWDFGISIQKRTIRSSVLSTAVKTHPTTIARSSAIQRFIPYKAKVVELEGYADHVDGYLQGNVFFLPAAEFIGERIYIINTSSDNQTVYNTLPDDPTSSTNTTWESFTLAPSASADFIAVSTLKWRQIV